MPVRHMIIDGNSLGHAATAARKLMAGDRETQGIYGFLRMMRKLLTLAPQYRPIVLWDGVSWRKQAFSAYKEKRDAKATTKHEVAIQELRASWRTQRKDARLALELLGIPQFSALNMEADDLAGILVRRYEPRGDRILLVTGDKDWIQFVSPTVTWMTPIAGAKVDRVTGATLSAKIGHMKSVKGPAGHPTEKWVGIPSTRAFLEYKALVGDTSDEIPGVPGIGEKGAIDLLAAFGSVANFVAHALDGGIKTVPKKFACLVDDMEVKAIFDRNIDLMDLNSPKIPAPIQPAVVSKTPDPVAFGELCEQLQFNQFLADLDGFCEPFLRKAAA